MYNTAEIQEKKDSKTGLPGISKERDAVDKFIFQMNKDGVYSRPNIWLATLDKILLNWHTFLLILKN